ncbi:NRPD1 [Symbiodinium pilosum]|uniref:NRPD1 protein n=1 Tax=Symbiodinium pilosum TaxID=2952 RepID=A0A812U5W3_SYMPI|nr:NRPD1 [Symbiodinium pilosum]
MTESFLNFGVQPTQEEISSMSSTTLAVGDTDGASDAPSRMDGWQVVWSKEHGRNYYWHVASGRTAWERPSELDDKGLLRLQNLLKAWRGILHGAEVGQEIQDVNALHTIKDLLAHHPDATSKVGVGLRSVKVDMAPPPNQKHRCFWVIRLDGSQEDFSARKCCSVIRGKLKEREQVS